METGIPKTMMAVCIDADGQLLVQEVPVPHPGKDEVLIKIAAAPINPSDFARIKHLTEAERPSFIAGIEGSGIVIDHGKGILPQLWNGRRVSCSASYGTSGSWAEYMVTKAMSCIPLPASISDEQGSMLLVNPLTALAFFEIVQTGKHKAIINTAAASSLGKIISLLGKQHHIPVIHIIRNEQQKNRLLTYGAEYVLDSSTGHFEADLYKLAAKLNATLALDAVGGNLSNQLLKALPYGGSLIVYGNLSGMQPEVDHRSLVTDNKKLFGFYLVNWLKEQGLLTNVKIIMRARNLLKSEIQIPVQARFPLIKIQEATETYLGNMTAGKTLIVP